MVPTQYKTLYGELSHLNQYSVIEKDVPLEQLQRIEPIPGLHLRDFQGIVFTYDFHPVSSPFIGSARYIETCRAPKLL